MENDKMILESVFQVFSRTCVHNPLEVIIVILSLCVSLMLISTTRAHENTSSNKNELLILKIPEVSKYLTDQNSDWDLHFSVIMLFRTLAFVCIFIQFKNLQRINSKFILAISILLTLFSSILFNNALINWYHFEIPNNMLLIIDIIIYTLVVIDLKKCNLILNNALEIASMTEAKCNVVQDFASYASKSSLDTFFMILFIALGNQSDSKAIKNFSVFSCILLASNFFIFITVYPALVSLILQFNSQQKQDINLKTGTHPTTYSTSTNQTKSLTDRLLFDSLTNPVLVYIKVLMTLFLAVIHLKSKIFETNYVDNKIIGVMSMLQSEQVVAYTQYCLILTLLVFIVSKLLATNSFLVKNNRNQASQVVYLSNYVRPETKPVATNTDLLTNQITDNLTSARKRTISINTSVQTPTSIELDNNLIIHQPRRTVHQCLDFLRETNNIDDFLEEEVIELIKLKHIPLYKLETFFTDPIRGIHLRRKLLQSRLADNSLESIPFENYNYKKVIGTCCENIIGYVPIPLGVAGPLLIDDKLYDIPMATTEGTLVASTNRGCSALTLSQGVRTKILSDGMTRGPVIRFESALKSAEAKEWVDTEENFIKLKQSFDSTSRFARLQSIKCCVASRYLYLRFTSTTGDAMGMNMLSKGTEKALQELQKVFPQCEIMSLSGNYCTDKKPSAINWIEGRGKSVVCEATLKKEIIKSVLKTTSKALCDLNLAKNLLGSAMAGSIGGFNAHAANIVSAVFIACGQDPAQVVDCNCLTWMEVAGVDGEDLYVSCTMPSIEVGTVGGGTGLEAQSSCLKILGVHGSNKEHPGHNACTLARIISSSVLAGELSLMSALASGHLVNSHMKYNRVHPINSNTNALKNLSDSIHSFL